DASGKPFQYRGTFTCGCRWPDANHADTAKLVARQMGETYNPAALTDMNTNIRYGTFYFSTIQRQLSNSPVLATAGYNAVPIHARRCQPEFQGIDAVQYTESIP